MPHRIKILQAAVLTAPTSGTIAAVNGPVGQWISGGPTSSSTSTTISSAFITLSDLSAPQASAAVSEADIGKVQPGQKVNFSVTAYPNTAFTGTVAAVVPAGTTTSNVVTYTVLIAVDPADVQLLPGMTATVSIITQSAAKGPFSQLQPKSCRAGAATCFRLPVARQMPPTTFCREALHDLASMSHNDGWVRGAYAVCEMYGAADEGRFETILRRLSLGTGGTALTEGASWLYARWQFAQTGHT